LSQLFSKITSFQFSHEIFNASALLLDNALKLAMPLTNGAINQTLRHFAPLSNNGFL